ncbi:MAG: hypothetical protein IT492_08810 [Gammaproteobacteria bacterium]|nr:hypothetical protein [Gammaproteobacteria bacterium]
MMNPELERNLWLEVSLHKLLLIPALVFAAAALVHATDPTGIGVNKLAMTGFLVTTMVWGSRQAANSVLEEARSRTWDIQRMCALSPWRMTWGKLLGATAMSWYAGLCCLLVFVGSGGADLRHGVEVTVLVLAVAVLTHALSLIGALVGLHRGEGLQSRFANLLVVGLLVFLLPNVMNLIDPKATLLWFETPLKRLPFAAVAATLFAAWAVLGATRAMSMELKIATRPDAWLAFCVFAGVFITGFSGVAPEPSLPLLRCLCATLCVTAIVQSYIAGFSYPSDFIQMRRAERAVAAIHYRRALEELPLWSVSAAFALIMGVLTAALGAAPELTNQRLDNLGPVALAGALMMLRDLMLLSYFGMTQRRGTPEGTAIIYIGILDGLLPALLPQIGLSSFVPAFWPPFFSAPLTAIVILSVHCAVVLFLALRAYRRLEAGLNETPGE